VIVAPGGLPKLSQYDFLEGLTLSIVPPLPSIFTFHTGTAALHALSGLSLPEVSLRSEGQKQSFNGPMLITHWGLSGPAVLRCSAWMARELAATGYRFNLYARLIPCSEAEFREWLEQTIREHPKKRVYNQNPQGMPIRFWGFLLHALDIAEDTCMAGLGKKDKNRIAETVLNHRFEVQGKSPFKEEFVTAGGVSLEEINPACMESKHYPGLYFAGEVLDIDGITGGFNFQAAWTTGYLAGTAAAESWA
jgi:predicted Rossmann fold flavoprotein